MIVIPGGPWLGSSPKASRLVERRLPDFAIAEFPVTLRQYAEFLDQLDDDEREKRIPVVQEGTPVLVRDAGGRWRIGPHVVEGAAKARVPEDRELELPVAGVRWYDAAAYARWMARRTGLAYRLPTDLEWDKAMRGADGRAFPMGTQFDPSFAKTRDSRPEASQPEPIGTFVLDESPFGVRDLAGGVGDWTSTAADGSELGDVPEDDAGNLQAIWRGGAWATTALTPHLRYAQALWSRGGWIGFRLALSLDPESSSDLVLEPMTPRVRC